MTIRCRCGIVLKTTWSIHRKGGEMTLLSSSRLAALAFCLPASLALARTDEGLARFRFETVYDFCSLQDCEDGDGPTAIMEINGKFYGSTYSGGSRSDGTLFQLN